MDLKDAMDNFYEIVSISEGKHLNKVALGEKLTNNSMLYLDVIVYKKNCTVSYIAEVLGIAMPAVTVKVKELEKMGFVTKEQSESDKRTFYIKPTEMVVEIYKKFDKAYYGVIEEFEKSHSTEDSENFAKFLNDMTEIYKKIVERR